MQQRIKDFCAAASLIDGGGGAEAASTAIAGIVTAIVAPLVVASEQIITTTVKAIKEHAQASKDALKSIYDDSQSRIHHIVPAGQFSNRSDAVQYALVEMHSILDSVGIDINHPLNLIVISHGYHKSLHTDEYILNLYEQLKPHKGNKTGVCAVLISQQIILSSSDPYNYSFWLN